MNPRQTDRFQEKHDDAQGVLGTALVGVTTWTPLQYRSTGMIYNGIKVDDVFTMAWQFSHQRKIQSQLDSIHLHWITEKANTGTWVLNYEWGWYNENGTVAIPATLPNTGTVSVTVAAGDQYIPKISFLIQNLTPPENETYSSYLAAKFTVASVTGTINASTDYCLIRFIDAHTITDRNGSKLEITD